MSVLQRSCDSLTESLDGSESGSKSGTISWLPCPTQCAAILTMRRRYESNKRQRFRPSRQNLLQSPRLVRPRHIDFKSPSRRSCRNESEQSGKLQRVLADLKVATVKIPEKLRNRLIEVVRENLDAFAASPTDFGRTTVVIHTIKTGKAQPFRYRLRLIPFARRQYLEQKVNKLISINSKELADPSTKCTW